MKYWKEMVAGAAGLVLGLLGLGLGAFWFLRRHISIERFARTPEPAVLSVKNTEMMFEHVHLIQYYDLLDNETSSEDELGHEQYLNTMFLPTKNLIILNTKLDRQIYQECLEETQVDDGTLDNWSDDELAQTIPPIYCSDANIWKITFIDGCVLYRPEFNVPFEVYEEGDDIDDLYE